MKYCCFCGAELNYDIPDDDNRHRYICGACDTIHYQNPKIVAGCIPIWDDRVLLCKRAIEPRLGYWTLPAGFMELGETSMEAAIRETHEEANARIDVQGLFAVFNLPYVDQVYLMFRAALKDIGFSAGAESAAVELFAEDEIPWEEMAFTTVKETLNLYFKDRQAGKFQLHVGDVLKHGTRYSFVETIFKNQQG